jgi:hypothetical protein
MIIWRYDACLFGTGVIMAKLAKKRVALGWSKDDVKKLRAFAKAKLSGTETARRLRRTRGAVAQKAMQLGVRFWSNRKKAA